MPKYMHLMKLPIEVPSDVAPKTLDPEGQLREDLREALTRLLAGLDNVELEDIFNSIETTWDYEEWDEMMADAFAMAELESYKSGTPREDF